MPDTCKDITPNESTVLVLAITLVISSCKCKCDDVIYEMEDKEELVEEIHKIIADKGNNSLSKSNTSLFAHSFSFLLLPIINHVHVSTSNSQHRIESKCNMAQIEKS